MIIAIFLLYCRMDLSHDQDDIYSEIQFYSEIIDICQKWLLSSMLKSKYGGLWKTLVAYYKFIVASSSTGIERALGKIILKQWLKNTIYYISLNSTGNVWPETPQALKEL